MSCDDCDRVLTRLGVWFHSCTDCGFELCDDCWVIRLQSGRVEGCDDEHDYDLTVPR